MPRNPRATLFVGIKKSVVAIDEKTGAQMWRADLRGSDFVTILWDGEALFAANSGETWRLDPTTGAVLWHNELKGLGRGVVSLASTRRASDPADVTVAVAKRRQDAQTAAAAGAAT
jgi:outer membrane protein assembly factor BamB